jgi:hypothetical protein
LAVSGEDLGGAVTGGVDDWVMVRIIVRFIRFPWTRRETGWSSRSVIAQYCTFSMPCCGQKRTSERMCERERADYAPEKRCTGKRKMY